MSANIKVKFTLKVAPNTLGTGQNRQFDHDKTVAADISTSVQGILGISSSTPIQIPSFGMANPPGFIVVKNLEGFQPVFLYKDFSDTDTAFMVVEAGECWGFRVPSDGSMTQPGIGGANSFPTEVEILLADGID